MKANREVGLRFFMAFVCRTFHGETEVVVPKSLSCASKQCLLHTKTGSFTLQKGGFCSTKTPLLYSIGNEIVAIYDFSLRIFIYFSPSLYVPTR